MRFGSVVDGGGDCSSCVLPAMFCRVCCSFDYCFAPALGKCFVPCLLVSNITDDSSGIAPEVSSVIYSMCAS